MGSLLHIRLLVLAALVFAGCGFGPTACDEPDHSCGQAPPGPSVTIAQLRNQMRGAYPPDAAVPLQQVVVTAFNACVGCIGGHAGDTWVQATSPLSATNCPLLPGGHARACGMQIFEPAFSPVGYHPSVGDVVNLSGGTYEEFSCSTCGHPASPFPDPYFVPEIDKPTISPAGVAPPPTPIPVTVDDLQNNILVYIGVLVTLSDVTLSGPANTRGEFPVTGGAAVDGLTIEQEQVLIPNATTGTHFDSITGIATYFYNPQVIPRSAADIVNETQATPSMPDM